MKLPADVREQFRRHGRRGGHERAARIAPADRRRIGRQAVTTRWLRSRFGVSRLSQLALPGADIVDRGLADLAAGHVTQDSLLVSLAAPRLRREGIPVGTVEPDPERRLYELLEQTEGELAHARYTARLRRMASFADACRQLRSPERHA